MNKYSITYLGNPKTLPLDQDDLLRKFSCRLKKLEYSNDQLLTVIGNIVKVVPDVLLIEVNNVDNDFLNLLLLLKSHSKIKKTRIVALFPDKNGLDKYGDIYSFGIDYGFIVSEEKDRILSDLEYILNPADSSPIQYALAKNLHIPARVTFLSKISHLTKENIYIETSLPLKINQELEAQLNIHNEVNLKNFKVSKLNSFLPRSYFPYTAQLKIIFNQQGLKLKSEKDITSEKDFQKFYKKLQHNVFNRNDPALILDHRLETFVSLIGEMNVNSQFIKVSNTYQNIEAQFKTFKPQIICYQMQQESDDMADDDRLRINGIVTFNLMLNHIRSIANYNPFVLVFNQSSRSQAYRKAYNYDKIIVNKKPFELDYLAMLMDEYQSHSKASDEVKYLKPPDKNTTVEINSHIILTSISENIVTFLFEGELPPYSTFKVSDPLNIYITVVPNETALETKPNYSYDHGFISNTNEEDKMKLRKLVNILIKAELAESEIIALKSVEDLQEDIIRDKVAELEHLREKQRLAYIKKAKEESEDD
jgi:hypothetical protein